jgi:heme exporter protein C
MEARRWWQAALALVPAGLVGTAIAASPTPPECVAGARAPGCWEYALGQRLLYVHVPLAWVAYLGFLAATVGAVLVLARDDESAGRWMRAANETTTVFAASALVAGLAWSYEFPIYDPLADAKVQATIVLVAVLAGLWTLASTTSPGQRDRIVASLTPVAFLSVPASYYASRLVSPHPEFLRETSLSADVGLLLALATIGFAALWLGLTWLRQRLLRLEEIPW